MTVRILLAALLCLFANSCLAFEKGYYAISDEDPRCSHLLETIGQATFTIECSNVGAENITLRSEQKPGELVRGINLSKAEAHSFLQKQDKKDLLVIWFDKVIWRIGNNHETLKREYRNFVANLGFKRVLMLGGSGFGTQVFGDTDEIVSSYKCLAFTPGFYWMGSSDPELSLLHSALADADFTVCCEGEDEVDIGIGKVSNTSERIHFKWNQVSDFLKTQGHKQLLVIRFSSGYHGKQLQNLFQEYKSRTAELSYKRVLFVADDPTGTWVVYDTKQDSNKESK